MRCFLRLLFTEQNTLSAPTAMKRKRNLSQDYSTLLTVQMVGGTAVNAAISSNFVIYFLTRFAASETSLELCFLSTDYRAALSRQLVACLPFLRDRLSQYAAGSSSARVTATANSTVV